jgi:hypothetical protein
MISKFQIEKWFDNELVNEMFPKTSREFWQYYATEFKAEFDRLAHNANVAYASGNHSLQNEAAEALNYFENMIETLLKTFDYTGAMEYEFFEPMLDLQVSLWSGDRNVLQRTKQKNTAV